MARSGQASASDSETGPSPESRTPRSGVVNAGGIPFFQEGRTVYSREDMYKQRDSAVRPQMNEDISALESAMHRRGQPTSAKLSQELVRRDVAELDPPPAPKRSCAAEVVSE
eukprot:Hpha_TRINITY_DN12231_c0_g1::TRINITY_DN12231_c0_g1_i2::g.17127::m.17127